MSRDLSAVEGAIAIIPAAGIGSRMQSMLPKQYLDIDGTKILDIALEKFLSFEPIQLVILVISPEDDYYQSLKNIGNPKVIVIEGGAERAESVHNGLRYLFDNGLPDHTPVMVHDAARPCITHSDLDKLYKHFLLSGNACLLAAPVIDTLQKVDDSQQVSGTANRSELVRAFTPQIAKFIDLKKALRVALDSETLVTDEVSALIAQGHAVDAVIGRSDNIKITHPEDIALAEFYLNKQNEKD